MMLVPRIYTEDWMDAFDRAFFGAPRKADRQGRPVSRMMRTDVKELENAYELTMDLPGYSKEDLSVKLEQGYLTVTGSKNEDHEEKDDQNRYLRRERYTGSCSRSFYVGEDVRQEDIHASFKDGVLTLTVPKEGPKVEPAEKLITIE